MHRFRSPRPIIVSSSLAAVLAIVLAVLASGVLGSAGPSRRPSASPPPSAPASPSAPALTPQPPAETPDDPSDGVDEVHLANWPGVQSVVYVWDETDSLADARSGSPGRPGTIPSDEIDVASVDDDTIRLTWADLPIDNRVLVSIRVDVSGRYFIRISRPVPAAPTDGVVSDRVLLLDFHVSVPASDVQVELVETLLPSAAVGLVGVGLPNATDTSSFVTVWDETEGLTDAVSGIPGDGASVDFDDVEVIHLDDGTIRLTWTELPFESWTRLSLRMTAEGRYAFRLVREQPMEPTDAMATDRVLILKFHVAIPPDDIEVELIDTLDDRG